MQVGGFVLGLLQEGELRLACDGCTKDVGAGRRWYRQLPRGFSKAPLQLGNLDQQADVVGCLVAVLLLILCHQHLQLANELLGGLQLDYKLLCSRYRQHKCVQFLVCLLQVQAEVPAKAAVPADTGLQRNLLMTRS